MKKGAINPWELLYSGQAARPRNPSSSSPVKGSQSYLPRYLRQAFVEAIQDLHDEIRATGWHGTAEQALNAYRLAGRITGSDKGFLPLLDYPVDLTLQSMRDMVAHSGFIPRLPNSVGIAARDVDRALKKIDSFNAADHLSPDVVSLVHRRKKTKSPVWQDGMALLRKHRYESLPQAEQRALRRQIAQWSSPATASRMIKKYLTDVDKAN